MQCHDSLWTFWQKFIKCIVTVIIASNNKSQYWSINTRYYPLNMADNGNIHKFQFHIGHYDFTVHIVSTCTMCPPAQCQN